MTDNPVHVESHADLSTTLSHEQVEEYCRGIQAIVAKAHPTKNIQSDFKFQKLSSGKIRYFCRFNNCDTEGFSQVMPVAYLLIEDAGTETALHPMHRTYLQRVVSFYEELHAQHKLELEALNKKYGIDPIMSYI